MCLDRLREEPASDEAESTSAGAGPATYRLPPGFGALSRPDPPSLPLADARLWLQKRLVHLASCSGADPPASLVRNVLGASSTDNQEESAINLLLPQERVTFGRGLSYWSSKGTPDPESVDWVALRLAHPLVLVREIRVRPFLAWFQPGGPIYAPVGVRFRVGGAMLFNPGSWSLGPAWLPPPPPMAGVDAGRAAVAGPGAASGYDHATRTWVSQVYPVAPDDAGEQSFRLPHPVLCVGGCIMMELLGKRQRQDEDGLLYVCLSYVHVVGRPLYGFALDPDRAQGAALEALAVDPLAQQGGLEAVERRLHAAVGLWHAQADRGAWLVPAEGLEAFRNGM